MRELRESIVRGDFVEYVRQFFVDQYPQRVYPQWCVDALRSVNIDLPQPDSMATS